MKRIMIRLPSWHAKRLIWWAAAKKQSLAGMAQNVIQARVEANKDLIEEMLQDMANDRGVSLDELKQQLLSEANYAPEDDSDD